MYHNPPNRDYYFPTTAPYPQPPLPKSPTSTVYLNIFLMEGFLHILYTHMYSASLMYE